MNTINFIQWAYDQHDVVCNQKYADRLPYSMHLKFVQAQANRFMHLIEYKMLMPYSRVTSHNLIQMSIAGHDLIEDARVSYNQIKDLTGTDVAEVIFLCTEMRGRNRAERHNEQYLVELAKNELAVFVKLCDIIANVLYSILTNSTMLKKYQAEYPEVRRHLYHQKYNEMFVYLEGLLK